MKKKHKILTNNNNTIYVGIFIIIFVLMIFLRGTVSEHFSSVESYLFLEDLNTYKDFSYQGINIFYEIITELSFLFGEKNSILLTMFLFGIINVLLFTQIVKTITKNKDENLIAIIIFSLSNIIISSISTFSYLPIIMLAILWTILFSLKKPNLLFMPLILSIFIDLQTFIACITLSVVLSIILKQFKFPTSIEINKSYFLKFNIILPGVIFIIFYLTQRISSYESFFTKINYVGWITSNGIYSLPIIYLVIGLFGLLMEVKNKKLISLTLILLGLSWLNIYLGIVCMLLFMILSAKGIHHLMKRKWFVKELKIPTLFLLTLLIMFYAISFSEKIIDADPSNNLVHDIKLLDEFKININDSGKVLCDFEDCVFIKYFSKQNILKINKNQTEFILENSNSEKMQNFLTENNVSTVFISKKTLHKRWTRSDQGILLLLTQSNLFNKINNTKESLIYYYSENDKENFEKLYFSSVLER